LKNVIEAAYETVVFYDLPRKELQTLLAIATRTLAEREGWADLGVQGPRCCSMRVGMSWWSWGETVFFYAEEKSIRITSRCGFPCQFIDWGKNRRNVDIARRCLDQAREQIKPQRSLQEPPAQSNA
jgi:hypothetical protein